MNQEPDLALGHATSTKTRIMGAVVIMFARIMNKM